MWHNFFENFIECGIGAGIVSVFLSIRHPHISFGVRLLIVLMLALAVSAPEILFGYFPQLKTGWIRFPAGALVAIAVAWPFSILIQKLRRKDDHNA
jgi:hypothetical protein